MTIGICIFASHVVKVDKITREEIPTDKIHIAMEMQPMFPDEEQNKPCNHELEFAEKLREAVIAFYKTLYPDSKDIMPEMLAEQRMKQH